MNPSARPDEPICVDIAATDGEQAAARKLVVQPLGLEANQLLRRPLQRLRCPVEAEPAPLRVLWTFVPLRALPDWFQSHHSNGSLDWPVEQRHQQQQQQQQQLETTSTELLDPSELIGNEPSGLVLCRARNALGWQQTRPCLTLLAPPPG